MVFMLTVAFQAERLTFFYFSIFLLSKAKIREKMQQIMTANFCQNHAK